MAIAPVQTVIRAIADGDPRRDEIAAEAMEQIQAELGRVAAQIDRLQKDKQLVHELRNRSFASDQQVAVASAPLPVEVDPSPNGGGLSTEEKEQVNKVIEDLLTIDIDMKTGAVIDAVVASFGGKDRLPLLRPRSAIGTSVHFARERMKRQQLARDLDEGPGWTQAGSG